MLVINLTIVPNLQQNEGIMGMEISGDKWNVACDL
jgi:hypothetical protein